MGNKDIFDSHQKEEIRRQVFDAFKNKKGLKLLMGRQNFLSEEDENQLKYPEFPLCDSNESKQIEYLRVRLDDSKYVEMQLDDSNESEQFVKDLKQIIFDEESETRLRKIAIYNFTKISCLNSSSYEDKRKNRKRTIELFPLLNNPIPEIRAEVVHSILFTMRELKDLNGFEEELLAMKEKFVEAIIYYNPPEIERILFEWMYEKYPPWDEIIYYLIKKLRDESLPTILNSINLSNSNVRLLAFKLLAEIVKDSEEVNNKFREIICKMLKDDDDDIRFDSLEILGSFKDFRYKDIIISKLQDKNLKIRHKALEIMEKRGDKRNIKLIIDVFKNNQELRAHAASILGRLGDRRAIPHLIKALEDEDEQVTNSIIQALGKLGAQDAIESILKHVQDEDEAVRRCAITALGNLKANQAIGQLTRIYRDSDSHVRDAAIAALCKLNDSRIKPTLIEAIHNCYEAAVKALGKESIVHLLALLQHEDEYKRIFAAKQLGMLKDKQAVEPLIQALQDKNENVLFKVVEALGNIGDKRAKAPLIDILQDKKILTIDIVRALEKIGDESIVEPLLKIFVKEENWIIRSTIISTLKNFKDEHILDIIFNSTIEYYKSNDDKHDRRSIIRSLISFLEERSAEFLNELQKYEKNPVLQEIIQEELDELEKKRNRFFLSYTK